MKDREEDRFCSYGFLGIGLVSFCMRLGRLWCVLPCSTKEGLFTLFLIQMGQEWEGELVGLQAQSGQKMKSDC